MDMLTQYAALIIDYCLDVVEGQKLYINTTTAAEPLVQEVYEYAIKRGAVVEVGFSFCEQGKILAEHGNSEQLQYVSPSMLHVMQTFDAYLVIRAPYNLKEMQNVPTEKTRLISEAHRELNKIYFERTANGSMKRSLCQYPTQAAAQEAGMSLKEYQNFVYKACKLDQKDPKASWEQLGKEQQRYVDFLNKATKVTYRNGRSDISFEVKGRTWINSDGKANMPSGEVYTGPIEDSVNGKIHFDLPSIYKGQEVSGITLEVKDGLVVSWDAEFGADILNEIMKVEGARQFGEVAIGTNYGISTPSKNILFDEKIGGTVHMAIGQSYKQTGGVNESVIHWDMIADMRNGSEIIVDGERIYQDGKFLI